MGHNLTFTKEQRYIIDKIKNEKFILSSFYFTGGTALSYLYLRHRYSEDLDFFSEKPINRVQILNIMEKWALDKSFTFDAQYRDVVYIFNLTFNNGPTLKVDFGYYPYKRIHKGSPYESIDVDSKLDIAINKLSTINQRTQVKDFVDLYFLLKEFTLWDLIEGVRMKFNMNLERLLLSADFLKVNDFESLPRMTVPLTIQELKLFYNDLAKTMAQTVIEK